jgi:hypothetical protein
MIFQSNKSVADPFPWDALTASAVRDFFLMAPRYIQVSSASYSQSCHSSPLPRLSSIACAFISAFALNFLFLLLIL